jgi:hypothetical protein
LLSFLRGRVEALEHTVNWYFSLDSLIAANDRVLQFKDRLELPNLMPRSADRLHASSDGRKFEVRSDRRERYGALTPWPCQKYLFGFET